MKTYETVMIFTDKLTEEEYEEGIKHYMRTILDLEYGGAIKKIDKLGKKKLAYEIKGSEYGWYVVFTYTTNPDKITEFEKIIRIDENVVKFITVKMDEEETDEEFVDKVETDLSIDTKSEQPQQDVTPDAWDLVFSMKGGV